MTRSAMTVVQYYKTPGLSSGAEISKLESVQLISPKIQNLKTETCFNVEVVSKLSSEDEKKLEWILSTPYNEKNLTKTSSFSSSKKGELIEIGPRLNFSTPFSTNAVSICKSIGLQNVTRLELSVRYFLQCSSGLTASERFSVVSALHDRMTQFEYREPIKTFNLGIKPEPWFEVDVLGKGRKALEDVNQQLGLAFDDWDLSYYTDLFLKKLKRNPTSVECFDLAQSNSEHSRHWFFKGKMMVNGVEEKESLIDMIIATQKHSNNNNVIKFSDNSSAIKGFTVGKFRTTKTTAPSAFHITEGDYDLIFTAETHNFPTGVAPFAGATTGTGGRLRDVQSVGRGGYCVAGTAGYSVGNLYIPGYDLPWEDPSFDYPNNFAPPLEILIEASNGASDYGNKFGEPVICGFARSFGMALPSGRREWIKPIMFSGGMGFMDADMAKKKVPKKGMWVVKVGGPVYRIGVGGGAASSVEVQGDNKEELDFGAVQRGDAEMEQKLNRFIRGCLEMGPNNPILSIHDQGAGGNGNVLKELVDPSGAVIFTKQFSLGDPSISALELWGAEYQESNAFLCSADSLPILIRLAQRERVPMDVVGVVTGSGKIVLTEELPDFQKYLRDIEHLDTRHPVDLNLELVLGKMPQKVFHLDIIKEKLAPLELPKNLTVYDALQRVLRLPSVASKRYLTNKVDRCVTGLVAQQQCVGPLHTPLADVAVTAISHFDKVGLASSIGERPIASLVSPSASARLTLAEALSNLVFAAITDLRDVKCSGNWMWAAKLPGEGAALVEACRAMCEVMGKIGVAVDGGKDSLSMAARVKGEGVKAPGTLVISTYAPCPDITKKVTPDLKQVGSVLYWVDLSTGKSRLGASALAQCYKQIGDEAADLNDPELFVRAFNATQTLIKDGFILSGHDISDGGIIVTLLEMCFAGLRSIEVDLKSRGYPAVEVLFAEEVGWVIEVDPKHAPVVENLFKNTAVPLRKVGTVSNYGMDSKIKIAVDGVCEIEENLYSLFSVWEETSYRLELRQAFKDCVKEEFENLRYRKEIKYKLTFDPDYHEKPSRPITSAPRVAVIREEGSNGDREMAASLFQEGFEVWDVTMQDMLNRGISTDYFRGIIFPGGFSYADVLGSAKGWAGSILFHPYLKNLFEAFTSRNDTFSLGVCNGCQLMCLLGWVNPIGTDGPEVVLEHNTSSRFECRFPAVKIESSPSIMLKGMEGSVFGVWSAHGEGKFAPQNEKVLSFLSNNNLIALKYVDDNHKATIEYPLNPNGSPEGIAGICSPDGRHLAMMPHPERSTLMWQWPYVPNELAGVKRSPWAQMFKNAFDWCTNE